MRPISIKLDEEQIAALDAEAEERDLTRSQYLRRIIDARHKIEQQSVDYADEIARIEERIDMLEETTKTVDGLSDRVHELEERLDRREASHEPRSAHRDRSIRPRAESDTAPGIEEVLTDWRPGRSQEKREEQRHAGRAVLEHLRERQVASAAEFRKEVEPDHPVTGQSPPTWWKKTGREALKHAQKKRLVEFVDGRKEWEWRGE